MLLPLKGSGIVMVTTKMSIFSAWQESSPLHEQAAESFNGHVQLWVTKILREKSCDVKFHTFSCLTYIPSLFRSFKINQTSAKIPVVIWWPKLWTFIMFFSLTLLYRWPWIYFVSIVLRSVGSKPKQVRSFLGIHQTLCSRGGCFRHRCNLIYW